MDLHGPQSLHGESTEQAVLAARNLAMRGGQQQIRPEHLLLALLEQDGSIAPAILDKAGARRSLRGASTAR